MKDGKGKGDLNLCTLTKYVKNIWIVMGLVCREEIVGLEIRLVFFNIMVFEDKYYV